MPLTHPVSRSTWYILAVVYASMFLAVLGNMLYTNHVAEQSVQRSRQQAELNDQRWCGLLEKYREAYSSNPAPTTQLGRDIRAQLEQLYEDFRCASVSKP
ncbi:MAG TPA: hypothetical protein VH419_06295 [Nocardioidaceae bacterium]